MIRLRRGRQPSQFAHLMDRQRQLLSALELLTKRPVLSLENTRQEVRSKAGKLLGFASVGWVIEVKGLRQDQSARLVNEVRSILTDLLQRDWEVVVTAQVGGWKVEVLDA